MIIGFLALENALLYRGFIFYFELADTVTTRIVIYGLMTLAWILLTSYGFKLIAKASSVTLVNVAEAVDEPGATLPAVDAAEYLSRHGIESEIVEIRHGPETVGQALANAAAARRASYLVVGAYGNARALETVFGGVTRELFSNPPMPVFTAH